MVITVNSVAVSVKIAAKLLQLMHANLTSSLISDAFEVANEAFRMVDEHLKITHEGTPESRLNSFGRALYDNHPDFMPLGLTEQNKEAWMHAMGEAAVSASCLSNILEQQLTDAEFTSRNRLRHEISLDIIKASRRVFRLYDPPYTTKAFAAARSKLLTWRTFSVADDVYPHSLIILQSIQIREDLARAVRDVASYNVHEFSRVSRTMFSAVKDKIEARCFECRADMLIQSRIHKQSRYNMAMFILYEMNHFNEETIYRVKKAFESAIPSVYMHRLITIQMLKDAVLRLPLLDFARQINQDFDGGKPQISHETSIVSETEPVSEHVPPVPPPVTEASTNVAVIEDPGEGTTCEKPSGVPVRSNSPFQLSEYEYSDSSDDERPMVRILQGYTLVDPSTETEPFQMLKWGPTKEVVIKRKPRKIQNTPVENEIEEPTPNATDESTVDIQTAARGTGAAYNDEAQVSTSTVTVTRDQGTVTEPPKEEVIERPVTEADVPLPGLMTPVPMTPVYAAQEIKKEDINVPLSSVVIREISKKRKRKARK